MHCIVGLLRLGFKVASIDLDASQQSLTRYLDNRAQAVERNGYWLPQPTHAVIKHSDHDSRVRAQEDVSQRLADQIDAFRGGFDFVVVDTPGADDFLSRAGHLHADTLITPINDSFLDLDLFVRDTGSNSEMKSPSHYAKLVMEQRKQRFQTHKKGMEWLVLRNRVSALQSSNNEKMGKMLDELSNQMGFRLVPGVSERVIYRELFLEGQTVLDLVEKPGRKLNMSHLAARQENRELLQALWLPSVERRLKEVV